MAFFSGNSLVFAAILLVLASGILFTKKIKFLYIFIFYGAFVFGVVNTSLHVKSDDFLRESAPRNNVTLEGVVASIPSTSNPEKTKFFFEADKYNNIEGINSKVIVTVNDKQENYKNIKIGDTLKIHGNLRIPFKATNPSQFSYAKYLQNFNVLTTCYSDKYQIISNPSFKCDSSRLVRFHGSKILCKFNSAYYMLTHGLNNARDAVMARHAKNLKSPNLEIMGGIVFGDDAINPPDEVKNSFINAGLFHLLAASGLNVGLIFAIWSWIGWLIRLPRKANIAIGMLLIVLYTAMTGFGTPVVRASIMLECVLGAKLFKKSPSTFTMLFIAGLIMLIYDPKLVFNVSFQLSYFVTFGIILCVMPFTEVASKGLTEHKFEDDAPLLEKFAAKCKNFPLWLLGAIVVPFVAQLWVMPLQAYYFNTFTPYSVFANVIALPFVSVLSFLGFTSSIAALIFIKIHAISDAIVYCFDSILNPFLTVLRSVSDFFSSLKGSLISVIQPQVWQMFYYYGLLCAFTILLTKGFPKKRTYVLIIALLILLASFIKIDSHKLEIIAFDVQNGDSFLIKTPQNKHIFIDTGHAPFGNFSQAKAIMIEYLKDRGIKNVDLLVITHFDSDHSGGAVDMMDNLNVKKVIINDKNDDSKTTLKILKYIKDNNINCETVQNNSVIYGEPSLKLKAFFENKNKTGEKDNENSIINLLEYKDFKMLFSADAPADTIASVVNEKSYAFSDSDSKHINVLKVAHHGSKSSVSQEIIEILKPQYAVISTGYNKYGHPYIDTVKILNDAKSQILRTDTMGAIKFVVENKRVNFMSFSSSKNETLIKVYKFDGGKNRFIQLSKR